MSMIPSTRLNSGGSAVPPESGAIRIDVVSLVESPESIFFVDLSTGILGSPGGEEAQRPPSSCPALCRASRLGTHSARLAKMAGHRQAKRRRPSDVYARP